MKASIVLLMKESSKKCEECDECGNVMNENVGNVIND
jgi:hypothetical protein